MNEAEFAALVEEALTALRRADYIRALALADQLVAAEPDRAVVRALRAQALLGADAAAESLEEARQAVELSPTDAYAQRLLALSAWRGGRLGLAQESFQRAIALSRDSAPFLAEFAWFMATERGPKLAETAARQAIEADAASSTAWAALGSAQRRLHRRADAEESLRRALRLNPNDIYAQSAMVTLLQEQRRDAKAEALADLLKEHQGTEEFVKSVQEEAKQRRLARILVERKIDLQSLVHERNHHRWIGLLGAAAFVALFAYFISPWLSAIVIGLALLLLVVLHRWVE